MPQTLRSFPFCSPHKVPSVHSPAAAATLTLCPRRAPPRRSPPPRPPARRGMVAPAAVPSHVRGPARAAASRLVPQSAAGPTLRGHRGSCGLLPNKRAQGNSTARLERLRRARAGGVGCEYLLIFPEVKQKIELLMSVNSEKSSSSERYGCISCMPRSPCGTARQRRRAGLVPSASSTLLALFTYCMPVIMPCPLNLVLG